MTAAINRWRGERSLDLPGGAPIVIGVTLDDIARIMSATGTETLETLNSALAKRTPETLEAILGVLLGEEAAASAMARVNGVAGLTAVYVAIANALSGLTPEEEAASKKAEAARAEEVHQAALRMFLSASGQVISTNSDSATG